MSKTTSVDASELPPVRGFRQRFIELRWMVRVLLSALERFYWDNQFSRSAALAYSTLFSLIPCSALAFALMASFSVTRDNASQVREFVFQQFVPSSAAALRDILPYIAEMSERIPNLNAFILVYLFVTVLLLISSIEYAMNEIWQVFEPRSIANRIAIFSSIVVLAPIVALSAYYSASLRVHPFLEQIGVGVYLWQAYSFLLPFFIDFAAFLALYYLVPKAPVRLSSAIFGATIGALAFGGAKELFALYIVRFATYEAVYGALAGIPLFLFWLYLAWMIVLFGGECCYQAQHLPLTGKGWKRSLLSIGDGRVLLSMQALLAVTRAFRRGEKLPNDWELAEALGCSSTVLKPALSALERAGLIVRGDTRDMSLALRRAPELITVGDVVKALSLPPGSLRDAREFARLYSAMQKPDGLEAMTLIDILDER